MVKGMLEVGFFSSWNGANLVQGLFNEAVFQKQQKVKVKS
jgi:hypothetical protein